MVAAELIAAEAGLGYQAAYKIKPLPASLAEEAKALVESDPAVRDVLFEVLSDAGYRTITATTPTGSRRSVACRA